MSCDFTGTASDIGPQTFMRLPCRTGEHEGDPAGQHNRPLALEHAKGKPQCKPRHKHQEHLERDVARGACAPHAHDLVGGRASGRLQQKWWDTVGEIAGLAERSTYAGQSAHIVASIRTEAGPLSFLAQ